MPGRAGSVRCSPLRGAVRPGALAAWKKPALARAHWSDWKWSGPLRIYDLRIAISDFEPGFHEPRSAAVPAASCGGVSPPARTPGETPGELAGEDACATSEGQFMVPMHGKNGEGAFHEPQSAAS